MAVTSTQYHPTRGPWNWNSRCSPPPCYSLRNADQSAEILQPFRSIVMFHRIIAGCFSSSHSPPNSRTPSKARHLHALSHLTPTHPLAQIPHWHPWASEGFADHQISFFSILPQSDCNGGHQGHQEDVSLFRRGSFDVSPPN